MKSAISTFPNAQQSLTERNNAQQSLIIVSEPDLKRHNRFKA